MSPRARLHPSLLWHRHPHTLHLTAGCSPLPRRPLAPLRPVQVFRSQRSMPHQPGDPLRVVLRAGPSQRGARSWCRVTGTPTKARGLRALPRRGAAAWRTRGRLTMQWHRTHRFRSVAPIPRPALPKGRWTESSALTRLLWRSYRLGAPSGMEARVRAASRASRPRLSFRRTLSDRV